MYLLILAVVFWGFFHSFNASFGVKDFYRRAFGDRSMKYYRLLYNVFAVITFLPILCLLVASSSPALYRVPSPWSCLMLAGQAVFASLLFAAVVQFGIFYFVGLSQLIQEEGKRELVTSGIYRFVRHPFYTFALLFIWL